MSTVSVPFQIDRQTLTAAVLTPITPPMTCQSVTIRNETGDDIQVASDDAGLQYVTIADGLERVIWLPTPSSGLFRKDQIAFWITAAASGDVVLMWA